MGELIDFERLRREADRRPVIYGPNGAELVRVRPPDLSTRGSGRHGLVIATAAEMAIVDEAVREVSSEGGAGLVDVGMIPDVIYRRKAVAAGIDPDAVMRSADTDTVVQILAGDHQIIIDSLQLMVERGIEVPDPEQYLDAA